MAELRRTNFMHYSEMDQAEFDDLLEEMTMLSSEVMMKASELHLIDELRNLDNDANNFDKSRLIALAKRYE